MGVRSSSKRKRLRRASPGGADLISGLGDDVLVHILELLPDAGDAVRTGALSRRWRGLWTRVSCLTFDSTSRSREFRSASNDQVFLNFVRNDQGFLDFVHNALAERAKADAALDLEQLAISFAITSPADDEGTKPLVLRSTDAAQQWISYAVQKPVKSFVFELQLCPIWDYSKCLETRCNIWVERPMIDLINLPSSAKLEAMHWELEGVRLQLPATAVFNSLVDLSLENIELVAGSGHLFARLLSSACCPSLQKLELTDLRLPEMNELIIEARTLLDLSMSTWQRASPTLKLKLKTPSLRILHLKNYHHLGIFAPKLEELTFLPSPPHHIEVDGELPCVGSLEDVELESHGDAEDINDSVIYLLRCCTSLTCLEVSLHVGITGEQEYWLADIISGRIPHLPHLISLTVHVNSSDLHSSFGVGLSEILKQCSYLKYLSVHCSIDTLDELDDDDFMCNHLDHDISHHEYLANIQEIRFTGLVGTDCESSFIQGVVAHATQLQNVALSFDPRFSLYNMIDRSTFIQCDSGTWVFDDQSLSYEWSCDPIHK